MEKKSSIIWSVPLLALLAAALACNVPGRQAADTPAPTEAIATAPAETLAPTPSDADETATPEDEHEDEMLPVGYRMPDFGFTLSFPPSWERYETTIGRQDTATSICFWFDEDEEDEGQQATTCVLQLDVYTVEEWEELESDQRPSLDDYLGETESHIVFNATPDECQDCSAFEQERFAEAPEAAESIEFSGDSQVQTPLAYQNEAYGFQLRLPRTWSGVETTVPGDEGDAHICFYFAESDRQICSLQIDIYTHEEWEGLSERPEDYEIGETEPFVFASSYDETCAQCDEFQAARHAEVPLILVTFEPWQRADEPVVVEDCEGGALRLDAWPVAKSCGQEGWTATIFVEGHGGDCVYTFTWQDEVRAGPISESTTFDVTIPGTGPIMGRVSVTSAGESVSRELFIDRECE